MASQLAVRASTILAMQRRIRSLGDQERIRARWALKPEFPAPTAAEIALFGDIQAFIAMRPVVESSGVSVRLGDHVDPYLAYLICCDAFEFGDLRLIADHASMASKAVVMGGGIGVIAAALARKTRARVMVYEANPSLVIKIVETGSLNNMHIEAAHRAVARTGGGWLDFHLSEEFWASSALPTTYRLKQTIRVPTVAFVDALGDAQTAFIDIEGGEADLFHDAVPSWLSELFIEIHRPAIGELASAAVMNRIWGHGFKLIETDGLTTFWRR